MEQFGIISIKQPKVELRIAPRGTKTLRCAVLHSPSAYTTYVVGQLLKHVCADGKAEPGFKTGLKTKH